MLDLSPREGGGQVVGSNERRVEIIKTLEGRRRETIANLAKEFDVSVRTIKYDIEALAAEFPVEAIRGNGGGIRLPNGYREYSGILTELQQSALFAAIVKVNAATAKHLSEILRAHGSFRNRAKIQEVVDRLKHEMFNCANHGNRLQNIQHLE